MRDVARSVLWLLPLVLACGGPDPSDQAPVEGAVAMTDPAWEVQYEDTTSLFIGMSVVDANTVWVAGQTGIVGRTVDGGANWTVTTVPGAETMAFRDVHAFSADEAFVLSIGNGPNSRIYHTTDGGVMWELSFQNEDPEAFFDCLSFWDRQRGFAFSDSHDGAFTLIRTVDGGASWGRIDPALVPDARPGEGAFAASGTCVVTRPGGLGWFATGASAVDTRVIRTTDYGESWSEAPTPVESGASTAGIFSIAFLDDMHGAVVGGDDQRRDSVFSAVATTDDGGATWTLAGRTGLGGAAYGVSYVPDAATPTLVAVSPLGSVYSTDNGLSWTQIDEHNYWTVSFLSPDVGWAAGQGRIARVRNGTARQPSP